jgi:hypothetical protein
VFCLALAKIEMSVHYCLFFFFHCSQSAVIRFDDGWAVVAIVDRAGMPTMAVLFWPPERRDD